MVGSGRRAAAKEDELNVDRRHPSPAASSPRRPRSLRRFSLLAALGTLAESPRRHHHHHQHHPSLV